MVLDVSSRIYEERISKINVSARGPFAADHANVS